MVEELRCDECEEPFLLPGNVFAWELILLAFPGLFDGFGGINYGAISYVMDLYAVPAWERQELYEKFLAVIAVAREKKPK